MLHDLITKIEGMPRPIPGRYADQAEAFRDGFEAARAQALSILGDQPAAVTTPCQGMNCGCTDGRSHSPECEAQHAATVAGGTFVSPSLGSAIAAMPGDEWEASPTAGMSLGQRIAHVGGRMNAQGYIEFGSPMAVDALIRHVLRDMSVADERGAFEARAAEFGFRDGELVAVHHYAEACARQAWQARTALAAPAAPQKCRSTEKVQEHPESAGDAGAPQEPETMEEILRRERERPYAPALPADPTLPERDQSRSAEQQGLFRKFDVRRVDGSDAPGGKHHGCRYFVLDVDHDVHAGAALTAYAAACESTHPGLARDLREKWGAPPQAALQVAPAVPLSLTDAEIERGWHATFSTSNPYCPCKLKSFTKAVRWAIHALTTQGASDA